MGLGERGDYVNQMKKCSVCRSRVSPCGFPLVAPASPPLFSLALPLCRMSDPVSTAPLPAWERHEALRHKQNTDKNTRHAMCRPVSQNTPSALSLSPFSIHLVTLSFIHTHTHKLRVQTKSQQSAGHNRHSSSCRYYHTCLIICVQSSRQTCGEIFEGFVVPRAQFTLIGEFVYSLSSPANPPQPVTHTFQGTGADFQTALSRISRAE